MAKSGVCCGRLKEPKALMKFGLSVVLIGHVNFLLAALVHGAVLRHINLNPTARGMEYAISNVLAMVAGLVGVIIGIMAIVLSKNNSRRALTWGLWALSLVSALLAAASAIGLLVSTVRAIVNRGRSLLTHCRFPDAIGSYSYVTNECPFDPTRIYSTTLILWFPLIGMSVVQLVYSSWCMSACSSFLGLSCCCSCCPRHKPPREITRPHVRGQHNERQARPAEQHELLAQPQPPPRSLLQPNRASQLSRDSFWI
ncbi:transmembrane protein 54b isoform X2 [Sardina pilchardus]|uniref:transmembrane protein 54b isoform X2 n=1 Tax=Sardina pilchardus TaxID=27697 RepID=UPI002E0D2BBD